MRGTYTNTAINTVLTDFLIKKTRKRYKKLRKESCYIAVYPKLNQNGGFLTDNKISFFKRTKKALKFFNANTLTHNLMMRTRKRSVVENYDIWENAGGKIIKTY